MADINNPKRSLRSRFNRGSSSSMYFTNSQLLQPVKTHSKEQLILPSFANMVNIFMGSSGNKSSLETGTGNNNNQRQKKLTEEVRIRKSSHLLKRKRTNGEGLQSMSPAQMRGYQSGNTLDTKESTTGGLSMPRLLQMPRGDNFVRDPLDVL